jgi:mono/diheme cytochrome c family protein
VDGIAAPVEETATTDIPAEPRLPQDLFVSMACASCHNINEVQSEANRGPIAPHLGGLHEVAATRVAGEDAVTYVKTSIVNPTAFVAEAYAPLMPANFTEKMSEEEIDALVAWILDPNREQ